MSEASTTTHWRVLWEGGEVDEFDDEGEMTEFLSQFPKSNPTIQTQTITTIISDWSDE